MSWDSGAYQFQTAPPGVVHLEDFSVGIAAGACNVAVQGSGFPLAGVVVNDIDIGTLGFKVTSLSGFAESPERQLTESAGDEEVSGTIVTERRVAARRARITCYRRDADPAVIAAAIEQLHDLLAEEDPLRLTLDSSPSRVLYAELVSDPFEPLGRYFIATEWQGEIELYAPDPWFYDIAESSQPGIKATPVTLALGNGPVQLDLLIAGPGNDLAVQAYDWQGVLRAELKFTGASLSSGEYLAIRCKQGQQSMYRNNTGLFGEGTPAHSERSDGTYITIKRTWSKYRTGQFAKLACTGLTGAGEMTASWHNAWTKG